MATPMGYEAILYYGSAGSTAATQLTNCQDLEYSLDPEKGETTVRGTGSSVPIVTSRVTAIKPQITWKMIYKTGDASLTALRAAAATGAAVALRYVPVSGGTGFDGDCTLSIKNGAPLKGDQTFEFTAEPTDETRTPLLNS